MAPKRPHFRSSLLTTLLFVSLAITILPAQSNDVCQNTDCPSDIYAVQLDAPPQGPVSSQRTEQFKAAYQQVRQIKAGLSADWNDRYQGNTLGGRNCVRLNQLEAFFAYEYGRNPDFQQFIDQGGTNAVAFLENGFEGSRRALNLLHRMQSRCSREIRQLNETAGPSTEDLPAIYMNLGQRLGYFDEEGNLLKPLKDFAPTAPEEDPGRKALIAQLKEQVSNLPIGQDTRDQLDGLQKDLSNARPRLDLLKGALGLMNSRLAALLPGPVGLISKINTAMDIISALTGWDPKLAFSGLVSKIGNLFKRGDKLSKRAQKLAEKSQKLKDKHDDLTRETDGLEKEITARTTAIDQLQAQLEELARKKAELTAQLEDQPHPILDELQQKVSDAALQADGLVQETEKEAQHKEELLKKLEELEKAKDELTEEMARLEQETEDLTQEQEDLSREAGEVAAKVEKAKAMEKALADLKPEEDLKAELTLCEEDLQQLLTSITGVEETQGTLKKKMGGLLSWPGKLLDKVTDLKLLQNKLKLGKNGIPIVARALAKLDGLTGKASALGSVLETMTGKKTRLQERVESIDQKIAQARNSYNTRTANLGQLQNDLLGLIAEKAGLSDKLDHMSGDTEQAEALLTDFLNRYRLFEGKEKCIGLEELEARIEDIQKDQAETAPAVAELEEELRAAEQQTEQLEQETQAVELEIEEETAKAAELQEEETALREAYGSDLTLRPVPVTEWAESFEVARTYWDAVFHPDDEVVEGYKGKYFEVRLKNADKNVQLLFGPGEYALTKSDFRKKYGRTIGAFATEALHTLKKTDREKVILFIQGSADITGHTTFSGRLDETYFYEEISVLPQTGPERFSSRPVQKKIPADGFRNDHLPDLRARFLREMVSVYSKKFEPVILEGTVKDFRAEEERNAVIYLFIPEELLAGEE